MNKAILTGRLVRDPEVKYSQSANPVAIARYTLAVPKRFKKQGDSEADFINCVALGKNGEFAEKWLKKGQMISVVGRIQVRSWDDQSGQKRWATEVVVEEHYFCGGKNESGGQQTSQSAPSQDGFYPIDENIEDDDLPF